MANYSVKKRESLWGYTFLTPWILGFLLFFIGPMLVSLVWSFTDYNLLSGRPMRFNDFDNWKRLFTDPLVAQSLAVTGRFLLISLPLQLLAPLGLAVLLNARHLIGTPLFRSLFYLPQMVPGIATAIIWLGVLNTQSGWINRFLGDIGVRGPDWFGDPAWVVPGLTLVGLWSIGNTMVIFLAGLQGVPTELYEAARVDGANGWLSFWKITLPMISPVFFYNLVMAVIAGFRYFDIAYVQFNGRAGPQNSALFYMLNLYKEGFVFNNMGYASALAWALFLVALAVTILLFTTAGRWVYYSGGDR